MPTKSNDKTALIFGATGLVGNELTRLLLSDEHYNCVKIFVRKKISLEHPRLVQLVNSLDNPEEISEEIKGDDLFCCLGTTIKKAGSKEAFEKVDLHLPMKIAVIASKNRVSKFLVVSSIGANAETRNFYLRTKGKMEQGISAIKFDSICIVRPSLLLGKRNESRPGEVFGKVFMAIISIVLFGPLKKYKGIHAKTVARAMISLAESDEKRIIMESDKLQQAGKIKN